MDLHYLLERFRTATSSARNAATDQARWAHQTMADTYAARISAAKSLEQFEARR